jgi:hypothetical protein
LYRAPINNIWNQGAGIHIAPSSQPPPFHTAPPNSNICAHFAQGHCKFGAKCKESHGIASDFPQQNLYNVNHFQNHAQQNQKKNSFSQKMHLVLAPEFVPRESHSNVNYFQSAPLRPNPGNNTFNDNVSNNARENGVKGKKARAAGYSGGDSSDIYNNKFGGNAGFQNVNNQGRNKRNNNFVPNIPKNNGFYKPDVGNFNGQARPYRNGNIGQGPFISQPEPCHGGKRRGRRS